MILKRKNIIRFTQLTLFFVVILLFYFTYQNQISINKNDSFQKTDSNQQKNEVIEEQKNKFEFVEYKGKDTSGNEFIINSDIAEFKTEKPELIYMQKVTATFYLGNGTLIVTSDEGIYNNITSDIFFSKNIIAKMNEKILTADNLDYFNSKNMMNVYGNVKANGIEGTVIADKADLDLITKSLSLSMLGDKQVNLKLN